MKIRYILFCALFCASCSVTHPNKIVGSYKSYCVLYGYPSLIAEFNIDSTFIYKKPYLDEFSGTWTIKNDTLILYSNKFNTQLTDSSKLTPKYNYTDLEGRDAFLIRGRKLFSITKNGYSRDCFLSKVKKK